MSEQPSADARRPPGLTDDEWSALLRGGGTICRGRQYEDDEDVHEIRWPNGAVTDLRHTLPQRGYATGGLVSAPKPGDPSVLLGGCVFWPSRPMSTLSDVTITMNFEGGFTGELSPESVEAIKALTAGLPVDPRVDEEWDAWRCPGCGRSHDEVGAGHAWQVDGAGNASCNAD